MAEELVGASAHASLEAASPQDFPEFPWLDAPFERGLWKKVRTVGEGQFGSKFILVRCTNALEMPGLPEVFVIKRTAKDAGVLTGQTAGSVCAMETAHNELAVQAACEKCVCLAKRYGIWQDSKFLYTALEDCGGGDVYTWLSTQVCRGESVGKKIAHQMFTALLELHTCGFAHMDARLENFHLTTERLVKLTEFSQACRTTTPCLRGGLSAAWRRLEDSAAIAGHRNYVPPEFLEIPKTEELDLSKVDSFQVGVALFALLVGSYPVLPWQPPLPQVAQIPGHSRSPLDCTEFDSSQQLHDCFNLSQYQGCLSDNCRDLLEQLLAPCPENRPTMRIALKHSWFQS